MEAVALSGGAEVQPGWVFAGEPVAVIAVPHDGRGRLPNGHFLGAGLLTEVNLTRKGNGAFLAIPTLDVLRGRNPEVPDADLERFALWLFRPMVAQARQLAAAGQESRRIAERHDIVLEFDRDVVERDLREKRRYVLAYEAERDLLFRAAAEPDEGRARELAAEALHLADRRRARWLRGRRAWLGALEPLVLSLEGVSEWFGYQLLVRDPADPRSDAEILALVRGKDNRWSEDEGLALFLLIDRFSPGWLEGVLDNPPRSPFILLKEAIQGQSKGAQ